MRTILSQVPTIHRPRSRVPISFSHSTTFNEGDLVPIFWKEVLPGDTFNIHDQHLIRTTVPFIKPMMGNLFLDSYFFFVPNRLIYNHWEELMGENKGNYWTQTSKYTVPQVKLPSASSDGVAVGSLADYLGIPSTLKQGTGLGNSISRLPFYAYAKVWNDWFRDENVDAPVFLDLEGTNKNYVINNNDWSSSNCFGKLAKANKLHDYFTTCLPQPQKGNEVYIPLSDALTGSTINKLNTTAVVSTADNQAFSSLLASYPPLSMSTIDGDIANGILGANYDADGRVATQSGFTGTNYVLPSNLKVDLLPGTINDLRFAFQFQKMLEQDARGGTRYIEQLQTRFGVVSPDARLQRSECIGGHRSPISLQQVAQTSASTENNSLGNIAAYSVSSGSTSASKAFVEHGIIMGVAVVRQFHVYQQGVEKYWKREERTHFYDPIFSSIGEQPVYKYELDALNSGQGSGVVFGYNEAWADYRYFPSKVSGALRSSANQGLDTYHIADTYANDPTLGSAWMKETSNYLDRALTASSDVIPNFVCDFYFTGSVTRVMPLYSVPGFADHH